ncbi:MAG: cytochrome c biogenesis protein [Myxococcales bacterium]
MSRRLLAPLAFALAVGGALLAARPQAPVRGFDLAAFGRLPVLEGGRVKPIDSVARNALLEIHGRQVIDDPGGEIGADEWLLDVMARPLIAQTLRIFNVDNPDVLGLLDRRQTADRFLSFHDLEPGLDAIQREGQRAHDVDPKKRSPFERAVLNLYDRVGLYYRLANSLHRGDGVPLADLMANPSAEAASQLTDLALFRLLPPRPEEAASAWRNVGEALTAGDGRLEAWARIEGAWAEQDAAAFDRAVADAAALAPALAPHAAWEEAFNRAEPFYAGMILYLLALFTVFLSWLWKPQECRAAAFGLLAGGALVHTAGLIARMWLQGRPPVTNLYSSAVFVGWGVVVLGLIFERVYRRGFATGVAAAAGFATLLIAHHLAADGDTLEMMRAVLDSNFWLATHVVTVTTGYAGTFLAGAIAIAWVLRRQLVADPDPVSTKVLSSMVYGVLCFSLFFSFVGTVLGGIWADQSWGRFWGWDPKENGALLIVLWNAIILHTRMGGFVRERGLMAMAIFGNIVTSLSWFGVNMLGIGLHSYGFMDKAFWVLAAFDASQVALIGACFLAPLAASRRTSAETSAPSHQPS